MDSSTKITKIDLADELEMVIVDVEEHHNIRTYTSLIQLGINIGEESFDTIMEALPEYSILHLAVTSDYNSDIYPNPEGTLIIEDIYSTGATFRFYTKDESDIIRIWKGLYVNNTWSGWSEVFTEETLTAEKLKEKGIVTDVVVTADVKTGAKIGSIEVNGEKVDLYAPPAGSIEDVQGLQEALNSKEEAGAASKALSDANAYTDNKVAALVDSAPETLDTFAEVAEAFRNNDDVVQALNDAIGNKANSEHTHSKNQVGLSNVDNTADANKVVKEAGTLTGLTASAAELNYVKGVSSAIQTQLNSKMGDYSIGIYNGTGGNPKPVRFASFNYSSCNSENGIAAKISIVSGHGNGASYAFLEDAILKVSYTGSVSVDNFKYYGASTGTYDGSERYYGDIFWLHDATNKIVDFYCLMGQYARMYMTPWKRLTYSTGGSVAQYTNCTVYSSGTKEWANNTMYATTASTNTKITVDATSGAKSITLQTSNSNTEWRYAYASGITSLTLTSSGTFSNTTEAYYTITFLSGATATTITNTLGAYFTGDDCVDGVFTPTSSKTYELGIWWNGLKWQAVVRGV